MVVAISESDTYLLFQSSDKFNGDCASSFAFGPSDYTLSQVISTRSYVCAEDIIDSSVSNAQASNAASNTDEYNEQESSLSHILR